MTTETDSRLYLIRSLATSARNGHEVSIVTLANEILTLDAQLSAGGTPPEAWREGPDAPRGHKDRLIMAADLLGMSPDELMTALDRRGGTPEAGTVRRFALSNPEDEPKHADDLMRLRYNGADVLVLAVGEALAKVESLDGAEFYAWHHELRPGTSTPRARFASYESADEPDREPTPADEEAWDAREDYARGGHA